MGRQPFGARSWRPARCPPPSWGKRPFGTWSRSVGKLCGHLFNFVGPPKTDFGPKIDCDINKYQILEGQTDIFESNISDFGRRKQILKGRMWIHNMYTISWFCCWRQNIYIYSGTSFILGPQMLFCELIWSQMLSLLKNGYGTANLSGFLTVSLNVADCFVVLL